MEQLQSLMVDAVSAAYCAPLSRRTRGALPQAPRTTFATSLCKREVSTVLRGVGTPTDHGSSPEGNESQASWTAEQ